ncbi:hypothetical protein [Prosthecobacter sp.]|uniref:5-methylcytosine restriction system specificity protein McrC n=1 Tax=Prosthecobacter sp. TaxID=1965333 RepID=UPI002ABC3C8B|nr:hypothetical protein [Prosthecobacter sp.]MDZ4402435.1 hypothetical protein [Prosthecobacter sp.]
MASGIPILNLYYLLTYAWDHYRPGETREIAAEQCPDLENLFAVMLAGGLRQLAHQGVDRDYTPHIEETSRLRGRLHIMESQRRQTHLAGRMICTFDELSPDVLHNQILRSTAARLIVCHELTHENRSQLRHALAPLQTVREIPLSAQIFRRVQLHRNNRIYRFLLNLCELVHRLILPAEKTTGEHRIQDILQDEVVMHRLFEQFVRNFATRHFPDARVSAKSVNWQVEADAASLDHLPGMFTDVTMEWPDRKLIADCKYYSETMTSQHGTPKLKSENLYQLVSYLKNQAVTPGWEQVEGLLIYPAMGFQIDLRYRLLGHRVRAASLDLNQSWKDVHEQLSSLLSLIPADETKATLTPGK